MSYYGEEDLLAYYLSNLDDNGMHHFITKPDEKTEYRITIDQGLWNERQVRFQNRYQVPENNISYIWDTIIERFANHILKGTSRIVSQPDIEIQSRTFSYLANESRLRRRVLARALVGIIGNHLQNRESIPEINHRVVASSCESEPFYAFVVYKRKTNQDDDEYREHRLLYLEAYVQRIKLENARDKPVVGIAVSDRYPEDSSEDIVFIDSHNWDADYKAEAEDTIRTFRENGMWKSKKELHYYKDYKYPLEPPEVKTYKGRDRNKPCPCGSGKKLKKCCLKNV